MIIYGWLYAVFMNHFSDKILSRKSHSIQMTRWYFIAFYYKCNCCGFHKLGKKSQNNHWLIVTFIKKNIQNRGFAFCFIDIARWDALEFVGNNYPMSRWKSETLTELTKNLPEKWKLAIKVFLWWNWRLKGAIRLVEINYFYTIIQNYNVWKFQSV